MIYKLEDIAQEIVTDLDLSIAPSTVAFWIRNNIGALNNLIYTSYSINDGDGQFSPDISIEAIAILKKIYEVYNIERVIRTNLGANAFTSVVEIVDNGNKVRLANPTEVAKVYSDLRKQASLELDKLINSYLQKEIGSGGTVSVDGADGLWPQNTFVITDKFSRDY